MAKLSKVETRNHNRALEILQQDVLTEDDKEFVFNNYHEGATHVNGELGAFFTPLALAYDAALELGYDYSDKTHRVIDLCAGIGVLAYATLRRYPKAKLVCVELNPEYVKVGRKLVPQAEWICGDVTDSALMESLGRFDAAISNPPFGRVRSFRNSQSPVYTGGEAEFKVIDVASRIATDGVFIVPQQSAGFAYSGVQTYDSKPSAKYQRFSDETGIALDIGIGIDTSYPDYGSFKGVNVRVELACASFSECQLTKTQSDLFAMEA